MYREQTDWPLSPTWPGKAVPVAGSRAALLEGLWEGDIACRSSLLLCLKRQIPACFWDGNLLPTLPLVQLSMSLFT